MAEPAAPKTRSAQGTSRAKLIEAALEPFATRPYGEVTVGEVALVAGVAHGLLFHYFDSKRGLYLAALEEAAHQLLVAHPTDPIADQATSTVFDDQCTGLGLVRRGRLAAPDQIRRLDSG